MKSERIFIIGDVHGCLDMLKRLMDKISWRPGKDRLIFVGTDDDLALADAICPSAEKFDDYGDWRTTAELMNNARLIFGCGSAVAALGGAMGLPTIRVHDDIPGFPKDVWTNLGDNQLNYSPNINDTDDILAEFLEAHCTPNTTKTS